MANVLMDVVRWQRGKKPTLDELKRILASEGLESELTRTGRA